MPENTPRSRSSWRPQIGLRSLLALMLLAALACGWWVHHLESFRRQQQIAEQLAKLGCKVEFAPAEPHWLPTWLDRDLRHHLVRVEANGRQLKPPDFALLTELPRLHTLILGSSNVDDAALQQVGRCRNLRVLALWHTRISDRGVAELKGLTNLERVDFHNTQITGSGFEQWPTMPALRKLHLSDTKLRDDGLRHLAGKLPGLVDFQVFGTPITGRGFAHWEPVAVRTLELGGTQFDNGGAACLTAFPELQYVNAQGTNIGDAGLATIGQLKDLEVLYLCGTSVTAEGVAQLRCPNLQHLIAPSNIDVEKLTQLQRERFPKCAMDDGVGSWILAPIK